MKRIIYYLSFTFFVSLFLTESTSAQSVGISNAVIVPDASSLLEVQAINKGVLIPRVALTGINDAATIISPATSLMVYNNATAGVSPNNVIPGYYYNSGTTVAPVWKRFATGNGDAWTTLGNAGTNAATNYLGTTDPIDFVIRTNAVERLRALSTGQINVSSLSGGVNVGATSALGLVTADNASGQLGKYIANLPPSGSLELWYRPVAMPYISPVSNASIRVYDTPGQPYGIYYDGSGNTVGGYFRTTSATLGTTAVQGFSDVAGNQTYGYLGYNGNYSFGTPVQTIAGAAVYGLVDDPNRTAGFFRTTLNSSIAANVNYSNVWIANYNYVESLSGIYNPMASYSQLDLKPGAAAMSGWHIGAEGYSNRTGTGGNPGYTCGVLGVAQANVEDGYGVYGYYNGSGSGIRAGGYFYATNGVFANYAYVGDELLNRKITGIGAVSEIIPTENFGRITLTCPESPEYWYIDYGSVKMVNGKAHVELDPILAEVTIIDKDNPLKVITQVNIPESNGVAVINKTDKGFDIVELKGGTSSGEIDYQIVAKPKTNYGEGRFPQAPGPGFLKKDQEPKKALAKNNGNRDKMFRWPNDWDVYGYDPEKLTPIGEMIPAGPNGGKTKLGNGKYRIGTPLSKNDLK